MIQYFVAYGAAALAFLAADALWLGLVAKNFYREQLGELMTDQVRFGIAAGFYLSYAAGIVIFAVRPAMQSGHYSSAVIFGALFGFMAYGTYDFTNMATIRNWPTLLSVVDIAWGTCLTSFASLVGYAAVRNFAS